VADPGGEGDEAEGLGPDRQDVADVAQVRDAAQLGPDAAQLGPDLRHRLARRQQAVGGQRLGQQLGGRHHRLVLADVIDQHGHGSTLHFPDTRWNFVTTPAR